MKIENLAAGKRCKEALVRLVRLADSGKIPESIGRIILLPIPSTKDGEHIFGSERLLSELCDELSRSDLAIGYGIPRDIAERMRMRGALVFDAALCEDFLLENARLTALGAIGYILTETDAEPCELSFDIIGYGRIGKEILKYLLFLGARVRVFTSKESVCLSLGECGVEAILTDYEAAEDLSKTDVLINTAPRDLSRFLSVSRPDMIIELASGDNIRGIDGVRRLPGIPERLYPRSAGAAYYRAIENYLSEVKRV